jgi:iron complex transport system ATP-binding protein
MNAPLLQFRRVSLTLKTASILTDLDFGLQHAEILGVAGSNGAGKSSLLRLACGEHTPSRGEVLFQSRSLPGLDPRWRARHIAVLGQHFGLQFDFSVDQLVTLGRSPHQDLGSTASRQVIESAIEDCDLLALRERSYLTLSGGERQRVQLARVLAQLYDRAGKSDLTGQLLILDEPTAAMDIRHQERCLALLRHLRDRGCSILVVMHDINLLSRCADRLLFLRNGRLQAQGSVEELLSEERMSALFDYPLKLTATHPEQPRLVYPTRHDA